MSTQTEKRKIPIENQKGFIAAYGVIRSDYEEFATLLEKVLNNVGKKFDFLALVQARAKTVSSFAGKIISKDKYKNPLIDMTDLCGARVIVHFQSQVEKVCDFIKENFEIDEANSLDQKSRLKISEFGYRSIHYIITPKKDTILGVEIAPKFKTMKAEVQVRTLAEHVWADISHDRIYKTVLNIPEEWKREAARLSAILENADITFAKMSYDIDSVSKVYELQYETAKAITEIDKLKTLIAVQETDADECVKNLLKLSAIYRAQDNFAEAASALQPSLDKPLANQILKGKLLFEYGVVLSLSSGNDTKSVIYDEGMSSIKQSLELFNALPEEIQKANEQELSYIHYRYGRLLQRNEEESEQQAKHISLAYSIMPENPLYFVALMESHILRNIDTVSISIFKANIGNAIPKLKELIGIGIKQVPAWFAIGHSHYLLGEENECIKAYSCAVETLLNKGLLTSHATIATEITLIGKLKSINPKLSEQVRLYLNIAMTLVEDSSKESSHRNYLKRHKLNKEPFKTPVVIVAGGASLMDNSKIDNYHKTITELMYDFKGTIISGGTKAGIPGLVGEMKNKIQQQAPVSFDLIAYLPKKLPNDAIKSTAYNKFYETGSEKFSALDILNCWCDLIISGLKPKDVILLGIDGGTIATLEYQIALSLGAKVGLVTFSGRAVSELLQDKIWKNHPNLLQLPNDPFTVWALVNQSAASLPSNEEIEKLAPIAHEFYRRKRLAEFDPTTNDINKYKVLMPWEKLDGLLQNSNRKQVTFYEPILKRVGLSIRKADQPKLIIIKETVSSEEYDLLAQLEHARWNAERLLDGWKYGIKDIEKKLNPYIVSWEKLDDATKKYDYDPVDNIPVLLAQIGYEVYRV